MQDKMQAGFSKNKTRQKRKSRVECSHFFKKSMSEDVSDDQEIESPEEMDPIIVLEKQLSKSQEEKLRALADLQNIRKHREQERMKLPMLGKVQIVEALLPTLDTLELAMQNMSPEPNEWEQGVQGIFEKLGKDLEDVGVEAINQMEVAADTSIHEVIMVDAEKPKDRVCAILQTGYKIADHVIRPAKVQVGGAN